MGIGGNGVYPFGASFVAPWRWRSRCQERSQPQQQPKPRSRSFEQSPQQRAAALVPSGGWRPARRPRCWGPVSCASLRPDAEASGETVEREASACVIRTCADLRRHQNDFAARMEETL